MPWRPRRRASGAAFRKAVDRHDRSARRGAAGTPIEAARRFSDEACASLPPIRVAVAAAARTACPSPSDTVSLDGDDGGGGGGEGGGDGEGGGGAAPSSEEHCLDALETEMDIARMHARRAAPTYQRLRPYLNRVVAALNAIGSPRAYHHAVTMLSRFNEEEADTRAGEWLRRAFEERCRMSEAETKGRPTSHADTPGAPP